MMETNGAVSVVAKDVTNVAVPAEKPVATLVSSTPDRVLVKISNASGMVDVLVNGKTVVRTMKRVIVLRAKGIANKRVTVRASRTK